MQMLLWSQHFCTLRFTLCRCVTAAADTFIAAGRNALIRSPTGTGKTLAYVLPLLQRLQQQRWPREEPILILTPTRELAEQVAAQFYKSGYCFCCCWLGRPVVAAGARASISPHRLCCCQCHPLLQQLIARIVPALLRLSLGLLALLKVVLQLQSSGTQVAHLQLIVCLLLSILLLLL